MMDYGNIADQGTHDELLQRNELYAQIHQQQAARREFLVEPTVIETHDDGAAIDVDDVVTT